MPDNGVKITFDKSEELVKQIKYITNQYVVVGIPASKAKRTDGSQITNVALGYIHEFGSPANNIPARPFLGPGVNSIHSLAVAMLKQAAALELEHKPGEAKNTLVSLGFKAVTAIRNVIDAQAFAPLSDRTLAARLSKKPPRGTQILKDTGEMLRSITSAIRKKSDL